MSPLEALTAVAVLAAGLRLLASVNGLLNAYGGAHAEHPPGRRVFRLYVLRMGNRLAQWLISVGLFLAVSGQWSGAITLIGYGLMHSGATYVARRHRVAPFYAVSMR